MIPLISLVTVGFFLGMRHATDADHIVAISTIVSRQRSLKDAAAIGALWGIGHTLTVALVGGAIIFFSLVIPPRVGLGMEFAVALMLIILGLINLAGFAKWFRAPARKYVLRDVHAHTHAHGDYAHSHLHGHGAATHGHHPDHTPQAWLDRYLGRLGIYQIVRPLIVGVVHGLAGSAAIALVLLTTLRDPWAAFAYLLLFGLGTIAGMMLITTAIAAPFAFSAGRFPRFHLHLRWASGLLSLAFGVFLVFTIGFTDGLFGAHPHWTPQ